MDEKRPWNWVFDEVVKDKDWWHENFEELAIAHGRIKGDTAGAPPISSHGNNSQPVSERARRATEGPPAKKKARHHEVSGEGGDAKFTKNRQGKTLCEAFNAGQCDATHPQHPGVCPRDWSKVHQCNRCLMNNHGSHEGCNRTPAPPSLNSAGKGKGKGRGKRKGKA